MRKKLCIWTENESVIVDPENTDDLIRAMEFKWKHIRAKANPDLFIAVANKLGEQAAQLDHYCDDCAWCNENWEEQ